jgi:hypothetical protein
MGSVVNSSAPLSKSKKLFKEWIANEKLVSKEDPISELVKNSIKDPIEALSEQRSSIDGKLEELGKDNSAGEEARTKLAEENEALKDANLAIQSTLASLNNRIKRTRDMEKALTRQEICGFYRLCIHVKA